MQKKDLKYIYGPVPSWRLGSSLGIDLLSRKDKICTFDCVYCQVGKTFKFEKERKTYVPADEIMEEIKSVSAPGVDYITFSGRGDPTLAENLGQVIKGVRTLRKDKIAVITNSSLMHRQDVRNDLLLADFVIAKLDACSQKSLETINMPIKEITFNVILEGIKQFKSEYKGKLALQIMFIEENKENAREISRIAGEINPDEVQINTPLRPCGVKSLSREELNTIKEYFGDMNIISVYESERKKVEPISKEATLRRRGKW
jgi:wyosine [tRNA(Phe)-imidazoG37] synthetase (radical SAM superfamily)